MAAPDVVVIGAGIVGAACALACAQEGLGVTVIEAELAGGGATAAGMGHLVVMDDSEAQFALTRYSVELWRELSSELPQDAEYTPYGTIWVAADGEEMAHVAGKREFYAARGVATEILDPRALAEAEPHLRPGLAGGLLVPGDAVVYPPCAARYFVESAERRGAKLQVGRRVIEILRDGVQLEDSTRISAGVVVNAAGSWAPRLTPGIDVRPRKGHLVITDRYPGFVRHQLVELGYLKSAHSVSADSVAFNIQPRPTGQLLIGSSRQFGAEDSSVEQSMLVRMVARAIEFMPELGGLLATRAWIGFRAATPDKLPLIGPWPENDRLFLATGHEGLGITTSLATAALLADQLMGRASRIPQAPYLPGRPFQHAEQN
jgi:glycine/D-amino acid oxidase-like deaminating enzyme